MRTDSCCQRQVNVSKCCCLLRRFEQHEQVVHSSETEVYCDDLSASTALSRIKPKGRLWNSCKCRFILKAETGSTPVDEICHLHRCFLWNGQLPQLSLLGAFNCRKLMQEDPKLYQATMESGHLLQTICRMSRLHSSQGLAESLLFRRNGKL